MAMGAADVVPGVSGGTIAFITGIYERLLSALQSINPKNILLLFRKGFRAFWASIDGNFLLFLLGGIAISILSLAKGLTWILHNEPILIWSFFFGLIIASAWFVAGKVPKWDVGKILSLLAGTLLAFWIGTISPAQGPETLAYVFLSGMIAICAMILPGISGSFILLLMGSYSMILGAIGNITSEASSSLLILGIFMLGAIIGLLSFVRVLNFVFRKAHDQTIAALTGFMIGSLGKVWPWKNTLETTVNSKGEIIPLIQENLLPAAFENKVGEPSQFGLALGLMLLGVVLVWGIEKLGTMNSGK
jgi:putative membrane protein